MRTKQQDSGSLPHKEVDWAVGNSNVVAAQVGNTNELGWKNEIPDGWDCGYTYKYSKDSCPPMCRGIPLPATFGGHGGGGKYTQVLQQQSAENPYTRITAGRQPPQKTDQWVTWATHTHKPLASVYDGGELRYETMSHQWTKQGTLATMSPAGIVQAVSATDNIGGCGKRGRNMAIDEAMSQRGGERTFAPQRKGREDHHADPRVSHWFSPGAHNRDAHNPGSVRINESLQSEQGWTALGGGKRGRDPNREHQMSMAGGEAKMISPQATPQMQKWGTQTGGGAKGRNTGRDSQQSSNNGRLW